MKLQTLGVIPARYGAQRFPGKPLALIAGQPLVQRVYEQVAQAQRLDKIIVATDDTRILEAVEAFGGDALLTSPDCATGTDRVAEVARQYDCEFVLNIQGDEPLLRPEMIDQLIDGMQSDAACRMATLARKIESAEVLANPNVVKVVVARTSNALYFSRSVIPYVREGVVAAVPVRGVAQRGSRPAAGGEPIPPGACPEPVEATAATAPAVREWLRQAKYYKHLGIYAFRREFLLEFVGWPPSELEQTEKLEQLRALDNGVPIKVLITPHDSIGVDRPEDVKLVEEILEQEQA